ncbi:hypothetical protein COU54_03870 [Candidatus Pacearchaeota archaeon CG10_big_fil_rev_8_21_14_0_10_31_24]|nr:MAG: hypothetical protein COU54_03870 [Candidatus Pacearchaeota archaeon CG10_big_fil_rev_8_21_14_0_10_31_24]
MPKKRSESKFWNTINYILSSPSKGVIESTRLLETHISNSKSVNKIESPEGSKKSSPHVKRPESPEPVLSNLKVEKKITGDYSKFKSHLNTESKIVLIFGKRGSGKSALGLRIMENIKSETERSCYTIGISEKLLPSWISTIENIDEADSGSIILIDEGAISFSSRESMKSTNKELSKIMAIARHKNLTLLFITQNTGMIDKNVLKLTDSLMIKEGSLLQQEMERPEIKKFYLKSQELINKVKDKKIKYFYLIDSDFEGILEHTLPSFWSQEISKNKSQFQ